MEKSYKIEQLVWLAMKNNSPLLPYYRKLMFEELENIPNYGK